MNKDELQKILREHLDWLNDNGGKRANLYGADLRGADLREANLRVADLWEADLWEADLWEADLQGANLYGADLRGANLHGVDLHGANLYGADLRGANLYGADLRGVDLHGADLYGADLQGADLRGADALQLQCPEKGSFTAYKKLANGAICELIIPEDAKRSSATTRKCRCDKAYVVSITGKSGNEISDMCSIRDSSFVYKVGELVISDSFDEDRWNGCSNGIHFFITKQEAIDY